MEIRGKTISYSSYIKSRRDRKEKELINEIRIMEENESDDNINQIQDKKAELQVIREKKIEGSIIRSRAKWLNEGEKPSNYFLNLESRNFVNKIIPRIEKSDGSVIENQEDILSETRNYFSNLYSQRHDIEDIDLEREFENVNVPKLSLDSSLRLEGPITFSEASLVLKNMSNSKSPGSDGFSAEFFKCFWKSLSPLVVRSLNHAYRIGELSITQKEGIITCIPKEDKPKQFLKNWRPITLLNTSYKIGSGVLANRLKPVLDTLISKEQTGFLHGRYIGENTRLIYDILNHTEKNNIPGLLLFIDFEKAFDSISWHFLHKVLDFFNFGYSFKRWIKFSIQIFSLKSILGAIFPIS
ncbi:hypothetical protein FSP39_009989 [Pinctada imbricata]|uniref:Reverse transcriptase domain-containing protein n=1 Tax=Pinctada imbricata TaxID=66713 RepID=A0AA89C813_PINIB|nr:hypothetical protein FSP39_009989 [Pinctada imbricata]